VSLVNTPVQHPAGLGFEENNPRKLMKLWFGNEEDHSEF
jgi:hypothetical protein